MSPQLKYPCNKSLMALTTKVLPLEFGAVGFKVPVLKTPNLFSSDSPEDAYVDDVFQGFLSGLPSRNLFCMASAKTS